MSDKFLHTTTPIVLVWYAVLRWIVFSKIGILQPGDFLQWIFPNIMSGAIITYLTMSLVITKFYDREFMQKIPYMLTTMLLFLYHVYCFADCLSYMFIVEHFKWEMSFILDGFLMLYFSMRMHNCFVLFVKDVPINNNISDAFAFKRSKK